MRGAVGTPAVYVVTGVMAVGKSTVADLLARRFSRGVHVRGDLFRKMIVSGRDPITPGFGNEADRQLGLRRELAAMTALAYREAGFTVVLQDVYVGPHLVEMVDRLDVSPLYVVSLTARMAIVAERERTRPKSGYVGGWTVEELCADFEREALEVGLSLDTSDLSPEETVAAILSRLEEAKVR